MAYLTVGKTIISSRADTFNDPGGGLDTVKWTMIDIGGGLPQTPRDIDATGLELREPGTATQAPDVYQSALVLNQPLTCRISMSVKSTSRVGSGSGAFITLYRPDLAVGLKRLAARVGFTGPAAGIPGGTFQLWWRQQFTNITFAQALDTYYRVGLEVDAEAGVVRGYLNPTANTQTSAGDAGLEFRTSFAIDSGTSPYDDGSVYAGVGLSGSALSDDDFSGADNVLVEEWRVPFTATPPGGAFFTTLEDPYAVYKSTMTLHERLNRAQLV